MLKTILKAVLITAVTATFLFFAMIFLVVFLVVVVPSPVLDRLIIWSDTTTQGTYKGIAIGDSRKTVLEKANKSFSHKTLRYAHPLDRWEIGPMNTLTYTDADYQNLKDRPIWRFYFGDNFLKSVSFEFREDTLRAVYRRTQLLELP